MARMITGKMRGKKRSGEKRKKRIGVKRRWKKKKKEAR